MKRIIASLLCGLPLGTPAATWYVASSGDDGAPATNWTTAAATIQSALDRTAAGDRVLVSNGLYATGARLVDGSLTSNRVVVPVGVQLEGTGGPDVTIIEGAGGDVYTNPAAVRCVFLGSNALLTGFTLRGGSTLPSDAAGGGGAWCADPSAVISNCVVTSNWAKGSSARGGGVRGGTVSDSRLSANRSGHYDPQNYGVSGLDGGVGGGAADARILRCLVSENRAYQGGGVAGGWVLDSDIHNNLAGYWVNWWYGSGGGLFESTATSSRVTANRTSLGGGADRSVLDDCMLTGNVARIGGGAYRSVLGRCTVTRNGASESGPTLTGPEGKGGGLAECRAWDSVIADNGAAVEGGGCYVSDLSNCIVRANRAGGHLGSGGGAVGGTLVACLVMSNFAQDAYSGVLGAVLRNCVLVRNRQTTRLYEQAMDSELRNCTCIGEGASGGIGNSLVENCIVYTIRAPISFSPITCYTNDPRFVDPAQGDYRLRYDSPCINAGTNQPWMTSATDFAGGSRIQHGQVDIGAFEYAGSLTDSDGDGLPDEVETGTGTYAAWNDVGCQAGVADSDGDGQADGREVRQGSNPNDPLSLPRVRTARHDYDGDARQDLVVYHPASGQWYIRASSTGQLLGGSPQQWGWRDAQPVGGDYDGDERSDLAVYHPEYGHWYVRNAAGGLLHGAPAQWGWRDAAAVPADYDGDGITDLAVYHQAAGNWYIRSSRNGGLLGGRAQNWGWAAAQPASADYDGDGLADLAVYHPAGARWYIRSSASGSMWNGGPVATDLRNGWPVPGDYDADQRADLAAYDAAANGRWYILRSTGNSEAPNWGWAEAIPLR